MRNMSPGFLLRVSVIRTLLTAVIAIVAFSRMSLIDGAANHGPTIEQERTGERLVKNVDEPMIAATKRFAFRFSNLLLKQNANRNVFVSPSSVIFALAMTYNGAEGKTRQAMARTLEIEGTGLNDVNSAFADLQRMLGNADPKVQLKIANSLWVKQGLNLKPDFIERSKQYYAAEVTNLDFNKPAAPLTINSWVRNKTDNLIDKIVDQISPETILFLVNAMYFKGQWENEFDKEKTKEDDFQLPTGRQKKVQMMSQSGRYRYFADKDFQAVSLTYGTGRTSMYVFLPDERITLKEFEGKLTIENWESWMKSFRMAPGEVMLPRFKVEYETDLNDALKTLGMSEAFDPNLADFSGIAEVKQGGRIYISKVKHKTFAEVNEEGTKAAAVTGVEMGVTSAIVPTQPFTMKVNRPFLFVIRDNATGTILFIGSIADPVSS